MHAPSTAASGGQDSAGRPTATLPISQLFQLSIYWFGINSIWGAIDGVILQKGPAAPHSRSSRSSRF
jgi:hypothetical protein